jgi:hypothetical protein
MTHAGPSHVRGEIRTILKKYGDHDGVLEVVLDDDFPYDPAGACVGRGVAGLQRLVVAEGEVCRLVVDYVAACTALIGLRQPAHLVVRRFCGAVGLLIYQLSPIMFYIVKCDV